MAGRYEKPVFQGKAFTCLHPKCATLTSMTWSMLHRKTWSEMYGTEYLVLQM